MKGFLKIISIFTILLLSQYITAQEKMKVDHSSDSTYVIKNGDTSYLKLVNNVYFYHNGTIISCDTAYYYTQLNRFEGIGNVIVNQDYLYIYGDKITYTKDNGFARVFAPLVKVVDSGTVMYTRNLIYNTTNSVAKYFGGATVEHNNNKLESINGFYDSKKRVVLLRDSVAIDNPDYEAKTDSLDFYLDTEQMVFECRTYIWKTNGDFLQSDLGTYNKVEEIFHCEKNSYVMTNEQETWADTISYYSLVDQLIMKNNIQMLDTVKMLYAFGDYGQYWKNEENVLLTHKPSIVKYSNDGSDTLYYASDTLFIRPFIEKIKIDTLVSDSVQMAMDSLSKSIAIEGDAKFAFGGEIVDGAIPLDGRQIDMPSLDSLEIDSLQIDTLKADSLQIDTLQIDSLKTDSLQIDTLQIDSTKIDSLSIDTIVNIDDMTKKQYKAYKKKRREDRKIARKEKFIEWLRNGGMDVIVDSVNLDSVKINPDSLKSEPVLDTLSEKGIIEIENVADSSDYIIRGYSNSKIFRNDVQVTCDTLISETVDSTSTFIGDPIMWNTNNQITAKRIRTYTVNSELYRARLYNKPIVAQEVEWGVYNQIKGNYMDAMFRDNSIYRLYVKDASETLYYMQDDTEDKYIEGLAFITSVDMTVDLDSATISMIKYYTDIKTVTYPIFAIPETQTILMQGFEWVPDLKPTKKDVFDREVRVPYRKTALAIVKPELEITRDIDDLKKSLIKKGAWKDRTEQIPNDRKRFIGISNVN